MVAILFTIKIEGDHDLSYDWTWRINLLVYSPTDFNDTSQLNAVQRGICLLQDRFKSSRLAGHNIMRHAALGNDVMRSDKMIMLKT